MATAPAFKVPIVIGLKTGQRQLVVLASANTWPKGAGKEGKHIDPRTPLAFMSPTRASTSQQPLRISSIESGQPHSRIAAAGDGVQSYIGNSKLS